MPSVSSFDWAKGSWSDRSAGNAEVRLCIAGDWAPIRAFQKLLEDTPDAAYGNLLPLIQAADLSVVNLEAPLSDLGEPACKSGTVFKGKCKHVSGLSVVPFDVVTLANNHIFDYGLDAFKQTLATLGQNHIRYTGAGMSEEDATRPLVVEINQIKIGIVNFSEGEDLTAADNGPGVMGWDLTRVIRTVKRLKKNVDFVLVISHCGIEYIPFPPPYVANAFKQIARAGADLVIGHHPHVPQGISFYDHTPICYSLGNFIFYQDTNLNYRKLGYLVLVGLRKGALVSIELVPYRIHPKGVSALEDLDADIFFKKFKEISIPLDDPEQLEATWNSFLDHYGTNGFFNEISMIMGTLEKNPAKGAAMFRNRLTTLQHYNHWKDFLTRMADGTLASSPDWARRLTEEWLTARIDQ